MIMVQIEAISFTRVEERER